ncbi:uncharacterized protein LOC142232883 [Haematobia irritans]|uniref:uncharacterized protein LOC142232883 n=1 Tax=Haematobia irritans TaxID=7368 RepID=UPI003F5014DA
MSEFIFDSDNLVTFCANFGDIRAEDLSDSRLEIALQELDERWAALQKSYKQLCLSTDPKTEQGILESSREKYSKCTHDFLSCKSKILDAQKALITPSTTLIENQVSSSIPCLKVPPCDTEIFYGSYEEWPSFRDMFSAVYGEHPKLSAVQKLYHLRLKTRGQAALIVKKYRLCGENFSLAWEALRSRYENRRILVDNQLKVLLNLKPISSESSEALQDIQATINDCLAALKAQQISTSDWDPILVYVCSTKLPHETLSLWEQSLKSHRDLPSWKQMDTFLSNRYEVVERLNSIQGVKSTSRKRPESDVHAFNTESQSNFPCKMCQMSHPLKNCQQFLNMNAQARSNFVRDNKICLNCLSYTHVRNECKSKFLCTTCNKNHHTLLHFSNTNSKSSPPKPPSNSTATVNINQTIEQPSTSDQTITRTSAHYVSNNNHLSENTLLPTAIVSITHNGDTFSARAFLDQGSEKTFISRRLQQRLSLPTEPKSFEIRGMGGNVVAHSNSLCHLTLYSPNHDHTLVVQAIVVPKITRLLPNFVVSKSDYDLSEISHLNLADPNFYSPGPVDLLIGSNIIPKLLLDGVKKLSNSLLAQATIFGWIISGPLETRKSSTFSIGATETSEDPLLKQLRLFWEQEEIATQKTISDDDEYCESFFTQTTTRNSSGRYIVKLPFKSEYPRNLPLGPSRPIALIQFIRLEQSLKRNPELANSYQNILKEYISLGHMEEVSSKEMIENGVFNSYYLPHHAVLKPDSRSTKVRVVFNASRRTYSGNSLNDTLNVGPSLQLDLSTLILNWRLYKYVFSGDIEKMYRQILVHPTDTNFQRILFRPDPTSPIKDYALKTVTFGVNSAPFLAIRTLLQLAYDSAETHPAASRILQKEIYVDDILSGGHDINSAIDSLYQLRALLNSAGFPLKKITSNTPEVLNSVPKDCLLDSNFLKFNETSSAKTLGIQWNALTDQFSYQIDVISPSEQITKRQILSAASKLFDPAGWISPIIVQAKLILQQLWLEGTDWDENVKPSSLLKWNQFVQDLSQLPHIKIPRYIYFSPQVQTQIHGFCDASQKAYCATIYLRFNNQNSVQCNLLVSKTKVAPIDPISLPRLELCGALLLSKLAKQIISSLPIHSNDLFLWCDSTIVLGWLEKPPSTWKTYVANRTAEIIRNVGNCSWRHVRSSDNPADLGSRGCSSLDLVNNPLWWHGPMWLLNPPEEWPKSTISFENPPEMKKPSPGLLAEGVFPNNSFPIMVPTSLVPKKKLRNDFLQFIQSSSKDITEKYASHGFNWSFIPPNAPHMGGIWEAGVKSFKTHFRKVSQNYKYTFEEFSTLLVRIEAVLNSRPLSPMTDDPHEILALTPGHFLRGAPLIAFPESPLEEITFVDRWDKLKCLQHQFARRWKDEYLKELHRRHKWQNENEDVTVGQLVVVKDELLPPCEWRAPRNSNIHQCLICRKYHPIKYCRKFLAMSIKDRRRAVRQHGYCMNCLARSHDASGCTSPDLCQVCGHAHNTLLHLPIAARIQPRPSNRNETQNHARPRRPKNQQNSEQRQTSTNSHQQRLQKRRNQTHPRKYPTNPQRCIRIAIRALECLENTL